MYEYVSSKPSKFFLPLTYLQYMIHLHTIYKLLINIKLF